MITPFPRSVARWLTFVAPVWVSAAACSGSESSETPTTAAGGQSTGGASSGGGGGNASGGLTAAGGGMRASSGGVATMGGGSSGGLSTGTGGSVASGGSTAGGPAAGGPGITGGTGAGGGVSGSGPGGGAPAAGPMFVYVSGNGPNITRLSLDVSAGTLSSKGTTAAGTEATYLAISPDKKFLYAVNEVSPSRVVAFSINASDGSLTEINRQDTTGNGAPHLGVHPSGKWVAVAHYGSGHVTVLPVRDDGGVGGAVSTSRGPDNGCQKAHQIVFDTSGEHLFVPCLGSNYVLQFSFANGMLTLDTTPTAAVEGGPRHMALHPTDPYAYVLSELNSTLTRFSYDKANGRLSDPVTIPSVERTSGSSAHLVIHPSGRFLYVSNRTENSIGLFALDATTGAASPVAFEKSMISTPRDFALDPSGELLISANQDGEQDLVVFRVSSSDGRLTRLRNVAVGSRPSFVGITALP